MTYDVVITCAFGVESITKNELRALGVCDPKAVDGSILVRGTEEDVIKYNLLLRTAERVHIKISSFRAESFDELFDGVKAVPWENYLPKNAKIIVTGKSKKSALYALSSCQSIIKKAILVRLMPVYRTRTFEEDGAEYNVEFSIADNEVTLLLNTSGKGLHKRGYRTLVAPAQMKETLASAIVSLSDMSPERPFIDPFCGCGTFVIEACLAALNVAPGINRDFDFLHWDRFDKSAFEKIKENAVAEEKRDVDLHFCGYDVDPEVIKLARYHARKAGIEDKVHFQVRDVKDLSSRFSEGTVCTDPPYGKRLGDIKQAKALTAVLGERYRALGDKWSAFVISAVPDFERAFGKRADKNRKFFNADELCRLYSYFAKR